MSMTRLENAHFVGVHIAATTPAKRRRHGLDWMALGAGYVIMGCIAIVVSNWAAGRLVLLVEGWLR